MPPSTMQPQATRTCGPLLHASPQQATRVAAKAAAQHAQPSACLVGQQVAVHAVDLMQVQACVGAASSNHMSTNVPASWFSRKLALQLGTVRYAGRQR